MNSLQNESVLKQVACVSLGNVSANLNEENLKELLRTKEMGDPMYYPKFVDGIIDTLISYASEHEDEAQKVMNQLSILQTLKQLLLAYYEMDVKRNDCNNA